MGKATSVLLIALLAVILVIAAGSQQVVASENNQKGSGLAKQEVRQPEPFLPAVSVSSIFFSSMLLHRQGIDDSPVITSAVEWPLKSQLINILLHEQNQNPCWLRLAETCSKPTAASRATSETRIATQKNYKPHWHQLVELRMPVFFSKNLLEGSPPGYFLII